MKIPHNRPAGALSLFTLVGWLFLLGRLAGSVQAESFTLPANGVVTNGVPGIGAGILAASGEVDAYAFTSTAGAVVYFDELTGFNCGSPHRWKCVGPTGGILFDEAFGAAGPCDSRDAGRFVLTNAGPYSVTVYGVEDGGGDYSFRVVPVADQAFSLTLGQSVTNGVPGTGAGRLELPGGKDVYTFTANAGQVVYFDELTGFNCGSPHRWKCADPAGGILFDKTFGASGPCAPHDGGRFVLTNAGPYSVTVYGVEDGVGDYSFRVVPVVDQAFNLTFGQIVTNGVPGAGAGRLDVPGEKDVYTFNATAGQVVYFDELTGFNCGSPHRWKCVGPTGGILFDEIFASAGPCDLHDAGRFVLTNAGPYSVTVYGLEDGIGDYSFRIVPTANQSFDVTLNQTIQPNSPAAGSGSIELPGSSDTYHFTVGAGTPVYFDARSGNNCGGVLQWRCITPSGTTVFDQVFAATGPCGPTDPGLLTLTNAGVYEVVVSGREDGTGDYEFRIWSAAPTFLRQPADIVIAAGAALQLDGEAGIVPPLNYQWQRNGVNLTGATSPVLNLGSAQTSQTGIYRLIVTNAFGSATSREASVRVYNGRLIPVATATRRDLPPVPGDGVQIELFNEIGGGGVPRTEILANRPSDGTTRSPEIDFPRPGEIVFVGDRFEGFFGSTTVPPERVRNLAARNFILRHQFLLRISRDLDLDPTTPEIELKLGVGSDDGYELRIGDILLGEAGDRSFNYSWIECVFTGEGLYPVTLLYAANSAGQSGLEFSWQTATSGGARIVPQKALYTDADLGAVLVTFEENPVGTVLNNQYAALGLSFTGGPGVSVTTARPLELVPISAPNVWAFAGTETPGGEIGWKWLAPGSTEPGFTTVSSFFLLNAQPPGVEVLGFDATGFQVYSNRFAGGKGTQERVRIRQDGLQRVAVRWPAGITAPGIDNLSFNPPQGVPPAVHFLPVSDRTLSPGEEVAFLVGAVPAQKAATFTLVTGPAGAALDTDTGIFRWIAPADAAGTFPVTLRVRDFLGRTDTVAFNLIVRPQPNLIISRLEATGDGETGGLLRVTVRELNRGNGPATGHWNLRLWLTRTGEVDASARELATIPFTGTLPAGQFIERTGQYLLPQEPGAYFVVAQSDVENTVIEQNEADNRAVAGTPVRVELAYSATVATDFTRGPAGAPIVLTGTAQRRNGSPAAGELVTIFLKVRGTTRILSALTDAQGRFQTVFRPLLGEAGTYTIGATHPAAPDAPVQDQFSLLNLAWEHPEGTQPIPALGAGTNSTLLQNRSDVPLTGVRVAVVSGLTELPGVALDIVAGDTLPANGSLPVSLRLRSTRDEFAAGTLIVRATTAEGLSRDYRLNVQVVGRTARLVATPDALAASVLRGEPTAVSFDVRNEGGRATGLLSVLLPVPWITVADAQPYPSLEPGATRRISLLVRPPTELTLGDQRGALAITDGTNGVNVAFNFTTVSTAIASLTPEATDEYTFYAAGSPRLAGARVTVRESGRTTVVTNGVTGANGRVTFGSLREGIYDVDVTADKHSTYRAPLLVAAGRDNLYQTFLSRETVQYRFSVVPTEIEDHVKIAIETVFETFVPIPVVTLDPPSVDLSEIQQDRTEIELKITNHGLIAAQGLKLNFASNAKWTFTPLLGELGDLAARSSITVPLIIERHATAPAPAPGGATRGTPARAAAADDCGLGGHLEWSLICATNQNTYSVPFAAPADCPGGGGLGFLPLGGSPGGSSIFFVGGSYTAPTPCDPCGAKVAGAMVDCIIGFLPLGPALGCAKDTAGCATSAMNCATNILGGTACDTADLGLSCAAAGVSCAELAGKEIPYVGQIISALDCAKKLADACKPEPGKTGTVSRLGARPAATTPTFFPGQAGVAEAARRLEAQVAAIQILFGDPAWLHPKQGTNLSRFLAGFSAAIAVTSDGGRTVSAAEKAALLAGPQPDLVSPTQVTAFIERWNRTVDYYGRRIYFLASVPAASSLDFIPLDQFTAASVAAAEAIAADERDGFGGDPLAGLRAAIATVRENLAGSGGGVCARVRLRLDQEAVTTRSAFLATLELDNNSADPLTDVLVELDLRDFAGNPVGPRFGVLPPTLTGLSDVAGTGRVGTNASGRAQWLIVPGNLAATNAEPVRYLVGGRLRYTQAGVTVDVPLAPAPITVYPNPQLSLTYFHQRDVLADDPFTDVVEPSLPYELAVQVRNHGFGTARAFKITSSQPKIIENEKGLLIDFRLLGTEIAGQSITPSLTADFGDLPPGAIRSGRWFFKSSLQGQFIDYSATFENVGPLKNFPELSTIDRVSIHELIRSVRVSGTDAVQPDYLVNDVQDDDFLPDTLYRSDGSTNVVRVVRTGTFGPFEPVGHLERPLEITAAAGWTYGRLLDPTLADYEPQGVIRVSDGQALPQALPSANFWTTDRTFIAGGRRPRYERTLHFIDQTAAGPVRYRILYGPRTPINLAQPSSEVQPLPASSSTVIPLQWTLRNNPGGDPVTYDIFAAVDAGDFVAWRTNLSTLGALYPGETGRHYRFYSVAVSAAGVREDAPSIADASTTVGRTNQPPRFTTPTQSITIDEGTALQITLAAVDGDLPPDLLSFALLPGAPAGATLDPRTGVLRWAVGEGTSPATNKFNVVVTDHGLPSLSSTGLVTVIVREVNTPPVVEAIPPQVVNEGDLFELTVHATDFDLPVQVLQYRLQPPVPVGLTVDALSGRLHWRPGAADGPATNHVTILVSDGLVVTAVEFPLVVRDTRPEFELSLGTTNLYTGESASLPIRLVSGYDLTELVVQNALETDHLVDFVLTLTAPEIGEASVTPTGPNSYETHFRTLPGRVLTGDREIGRLSFRAQTNRPSAIVLIRLDSAVGQRSTGELLSRPRLTSGRVAVIGVDPLVDFPSPERALRIYGHPGDQIRLERQTGLNPQAWQTWRTLQLQSRFSEIPAAEAITGPGPDFVRARRAP